MRKPAFSICENKDADQLRGNREADQRLCFRYTDSTIPLLSKSEISSLWPSSVAVQPGLCRTWSELLKTGFLITRLKLHDGCVILMFSFSEAARQLTKLQSRKPTMDKLLAQREEDIGHFIDLIMRESTQKALGFYLESLKKKSKK